MGGAVEDGIRGSLGGSPRKLLAPGLFPSSRNLRWLLYSFTEAVAGSDILKICRRARAHLQELSLGNQISGNSFPCLTQTGEGSTRNLVIRVVDAKELRARSLVPEKQGGSIDAHQQHVKRTW